MLLVVRCRFAAGDSQTAVQVAYVVLLYVFFVLEAVLQLVLSALLVQLRVAQVERPPVTSVVLEQRVPPVVSAVPEARLSLL